MRLLSLRLPALRRAVLFRARFGAFACAGLLLLGGCGPVWNDPYPAGERGQNILFSAFPERPKHLDPVQSYSEDEATFLYQIVEPPLQYHYLKRPYALEPGVAAEMPRLRRYDAAGRLLSDTADASRVAKSVYEISIRPGVMYQPHPAFARAADGTPRYLSMAPEDLRKIRGLSDFAETGTRELEAADFVHQIKRLAHPRLHSPIFELTAEYLPGRRGEENPRLDRSDPIRAAGCRGGRSPHVSHHVEGCLPAIPLLAVDAFLRAGAAGGRPFL